MPSWRQSAWHAWHVGHDVVSSGQQSASRTCSRAPCGPGAGSGGEAVEGHTGSIARLLVPVAAVEHVSDRVERLRQAPHNLLVVVLPLRQLSSNLG